MPKTNFIDGVTVVTADWANATQEHVHDGVDDDGHAPKIKDAHREWGTTANSHLSIDEPAGESNLVHHAPVGTERSFRTDKLSAKKLIIDLFGIITPKITTHPGDLQLVDHNGVPRSLFAHAFKIEGDATMHSDFSKELHKKNLVKDGFKYSIEQLTTGVYVFNMLNGTSASGVGPFPALSANSSDQFFISGLKSTIFSLNVASTLNANVGLTAHMINVTEAGPPSVAFEIYKLDGTKLTSLSAGEKIIVNYIGL